MRRIAVYYRVSTGRQDLDSQRHAVETYLAALPEGKRPESVVTFQDEGISGKTEKRPGYLAMLDLAYQHKIDTIVVYKLDRFSRSANAAIRVICDLDEAGVAFISTSQPVLNLGHENPFRRTMLAAFAEIGQIERETIVSRVKAGLAARKAKGLPLGAKKKVNGQLQAMAKDLKEKGLTYKQIGSELSLSVGSVHKMLNGPKLESVSL